MNSTTKRRYDPARRDRIIEAALDVIATHGVAGTTHRRVAEVADVPLGAMTYYFQGMEQLLHEAFSKLADDMSSQMLSKLEQAANKDEARQAIIDLICNELWTCERNWVLVFEMSAYAARTPSGRPLLQRWMGWTEGYMSRYFDLSTAKILDAFIDGVVMHNLVTKNHISREEVTEFVRRITV